MIKQIQFRNKKGLTLRGFVSLPKKYSTAVLHLHGFPSHCRGYTGKKMLKAFSKTKYLFMQFDFHGSDMSEGKFEDKLMSKEVSDVKCAIDFLEEKYGFERLILVGHSTGAIDASLYAHRDKRIDKLILTGAVSDLKHSARYDFTDIQVRDFWKKGYIIYKNEEKGKRWWCQNKKLKKAFYDEFFKLDIPSAIKKWKKPLLIVHGEKDETIPLSDPKKLLSLANKPKKLVIIRDANHSFRNEEHFKKAFKSIMMFIKNR